MWKISSIILLFSIMLFGQCLCNLHLNSCEEFSHFLFRRCPFHITADTVPIEWQLQEGKSLNTPIYMFGRRNYFYVGLITCGFAQSLLMLGLWGFLPVHFLVDEYNFFPLGHIFSTMLFMMIELAVSFPGARYLCQLQVFRNLLLLLYSLMGTDNCIFSLMDYWFYTAKSLPKRC